MDYAGVDPVKRTYLMTVINGVICLRMGATSCLDKKHPKHYRLSLEEGISNFFIIFGMIISGTTDHHMTV